MNAPTVTYTSNPVPWKGLLNPGAMVANLWSRRDLIRHFTWREIRARFHGTSLGILWPIIEPLTRLAVYTAVFVALGIRFGQGDRDTAWHYAVNLFCGLVVYGMFADAVTHAPASVLGKANLVKKVVFPIEILPVAVVGAALFFGIIGLVVMQAFAAVLLGAVPITIVLIPLIVIPIALLGLGLAWFLASLGVFVRDTRQLVVVIVSNLLFFLTPVIYPLESITNPLTRALLLANPLTTLVENARRILLLGEWPQWGPLGAVTLLSIVTAILGYAWFMKSKRGFSDVI